MSLLNHKKDKYKFKFQDFLYKEYGYDSRSDFKICEYYNPKNPGQSTCPHSTGSSCPFGKHVISNFYNKIVCKHWLRGLCKKNEQCEYLHEFNLRKMPECLFFSKNGFCNNNVLEECPFQHIDTKTGLLINRYLGTAANTGSTSEIVFLHENEDGEEEQEECESYRLGFCYMGPKCKFKHIRFDTLEEPIGGSDSEEDQQEDQTLLEQQTAAEEQPKIEVDLDEDQQLQLPETNTTDSTKQNSPATATATNKVSKTKHRRDQVCQRYMNGFCPYGKRHCEYHHPPCINSVALINKLKIKPDTEINTKKSDALKEARLNAIINGEIQI